MTDNDKYITRKMNVTLKEEEYQKFVNGEIHSDNGLRKSDGKLSSLPDIAEILDEEDNYYSSNYNDYHSEKSESEANAEALGYIIGGLLVGIAILSDEENRMAIKTWFKNTASAISHKTNSTVKSLKNFFSGETKAKKLLVKKTSLAMEVLDTNINQLETESQKQNQEEFRNYISSEEAQQQIEQIKVLSLLLANKIKVFSNSYVKNNLTPDELVQQQNTIKELTSEEVRNSMKMLVENESFFLEEATIKIFREFLLGNIIVGKEAIPIEIEAF